MAGCRCGTDAEGVSEDLRRRFSDELLPGGVAGGPDRNPGVAQSVEQSHPAEVLTRDLAGKQPSGRGVGRGVGVGAVSDMEPDQRCELLRDG